MASFRQTPMTREAANRIVKATVAQHGNKIPPRSVATRVDATVQRREETQDRTKPR